MKKFNNIEQSIKIVEKLGYAGIFDDEVTENKILHTIMYHLKDYEELKPIKPKKNLKEKTLSAVNTAHILVDNIFIGLKETLNQQDQQDNEEKDSK